MELVIQQSKMQTKKNRKFYNFLISDLDEILARNSLEINKFQGQNILIAGANGFIGGWLTAALLYAKMEMKSDYEIGVICRNLKNLNEKFLVFPKGVSFFHQLDLNSVSPQEANILPDYRFVFNCASSSNYAKHKMHEKVTQNLINLTSSKKNVPSVVNLSSGAVYGEKRNEQSLINEREVITDVTHGINQYTKVKIESEKIISTETALNRIQGTNARLFTFYGPHFPLDSYYAIGNFMQDVLKRSRISVKGNPATVRSYLYPTDLVSALLKLSLNPTSQNIHIGSKLAVSLDELATLMNSKFGELGIDFLPNSDSPNHYVPSLQNSERHLGIFETVCLDDGLKRWENWLH